MTLDFINELILKHIKHLELSEKQINTIFSKATSELSAIASRITIDETKPFSFDDYPQIKNYADKIIRQAAKNISVSIKNGIREAWRLSNQKNDLMINEYLKQTKQNLSESKQKKYFNNNEKALNAFLQRSEKGINLSQKVWNYTEQFKKEVELCLSAGIYNGRSATEISREVRKYLNEPQKLFRRVKDKHGNLVLSKNAKEYTPGRGVYRSSYKNAMRLTRTENNIAYRTADYLRMQDLDFVVGIKIVLSNNHTLNGKPFVDICDDLAGSYPKNFKFTGWHPQCRCHIETILKTEKEFIEDLNNDKNATSKNEINELPDNFKKWYDDNKDKIKILKTKPYFITDNENIIGQISVKFNKVKEFENGGVYKEHNIIDKTAKDYNMVRHIGLEFAKTGKEVKATPKLHFKDKEYKAIYNSLIGTKYERKCPDLIVNGKFYEVESFVPPFNKHKMGNMIKKGLLQSDRIIINNTRGCSDRYIKKLIIDRIKKGQHIKEVWIYEKGKIRLLH